MKVKMNKLKNRRWPYSPYARRNMFTEEAQEIIFNVVCAVLVGLLIYLAYNCIYVDICEKLTK